MASTKSSLSAGSLVRAVLLSTPEVSQRVNKIFPVISEVADLPYISYRRAGMETQPVKGHRGADAIDFEVTIFTAKYAEGIDLAEAIRHTLDGKTASYDGLTMRSCDLIDSVEDWQNDAYIQQLKFRIKI